MEAVRIETLESEAEAFDALVARTPRVDPFCSATPWILSAHRALMPPREPWLRRSEHGWLTLARSRDPKFGSYLQPLEAVWGFAAPFAGEDPVALAKDVTLVLGREASEWNLLLMSGLARDSAFFRVVVDRLSGRLRLGVGLETPRRIARLDGGLDGFLSRRSPHFRANVRRAWRRARDRGLHFDRVGRDVDPGAVFERVQAVERRSWKGLEGVGIEAGAMYAFYREMIPRLAARGGLRAVFAVDDGEDVAYVFGGVVGDLYRGLQMSYDGDYAAWSLGAVTQLELIEQLCEEGLSTYDMGQDIAYKQRWTDGIFTTTTLIAIR